MSEKTIYQSMPTVALRAMVMFPKMKLHFEVGRKKSIAAIKAAVNDKQKVFLVAQKDATVENPNEKDLFEMGIVAEIKQIIRNGESGNIRVVVEGITRATLVRVCESEEYFICDVAAKKSYSVPAEMDDYAEAMVRRAKNIFEEYIEASAKLAKEVAGEVFFSGDIDYLGDYIACNALTEYTSRQFILEELDPVIRLEKVCTILSREIELLKIEEIIDRRVQEQMDKSQHEYYLREQMKAISAELGEGEDVLAEAEDYKKRILEARLESSIENKLLRECVKLSKMQSNSADANVIRNYLDECLSLPWNTRTFDNLDIVSARKILDEDHYGLEKVKERFIEMLAVQFTSRTPSAQIICLVGPPGVGKTSIVRSVAKAMERNYVRMSLGGVRDEAEIRGHRKTYIGSMPGRIVSSLIQAGSLNPVILLDEVDKLGSDYKGDPSSALLEVLDPEQNNNFKDHYLDFPIDLSEVLFITTANDASTIPAPLLDRMEVINLSSYTLEEKLMIAKKHIVKKQRLIHGISGRSLRFSDDILRLIIDGYTREAGVRTLEQLIAAICRKAAVKICEDKVNFVKLNEKVVYEMLGPVKYKGERVEKSDLVGVVNGLAWTSVGGELLQVEAVVMDGSGKLELTGSLGDDMKESAKAAYSYIRSVAHLYEIDSEIFKTKDIHIHVPQGAVPKDGPSAGVTISTAILSALTGRTVRHSVAMTGEISLTGRVMAIGGLKEKAMAAFKSGIKTVLIPADNEADLWEVNQEVKEAVEFISVKKLEEVFSLALSGERKAAEKKRSKVTIETKEKRSGAVAQ
ncbi:MAG: endopeptidase La [Clostridia bacterium]|nr:endopeptidase La [Clostridia bacterium]